MIINKSDKSEERIQEPKSNPWALLPMLVFIVLYVITSIAVISIPTLYEVFISPPIIPAFFIALIVALFQNRKISLKEKITTIGKGIGNSSIISMLMIFILAGIFAGTVGKESAASVAHFFLSIIPTQFSALVIFIVSCLVSLAMGTSVGSVTIMTPIAISVSAASGQSLPMCVACSICGSMFGDNLSMISDTAIAACSGMEVDPREKFFANLRMCLPAAFITMIIIFIMCLTQGQAPQVIESYDMLAFIPYALVLILSIIGVNVFICLGCGILSGSIILLITGKVEILDLLGNMVGGAEGMYELIIITLIVSAMAALIRRNGGFATVLGLIKKLCKDEKRALLGTGFMVSALDLITANNTVAIVMSTPICREIRKIYHISKRRMASVMDTFSCIAQGLLPYGAQMIIAVGLCCFSGFPISAFDIMPLCLYQYILLIVILFQLLTGLADTKKRAQNRKKKKDAKA